MMIKSRKKSSKRMKIAIHNQSDLITVTLATTRIHPRYKQDVADRLVLGALHVAYGQTDVVFQGPFPSSFSLDPADHSLTVQYDDDTVSRLEIRNNHGFDVSGCVQRQRLAHGWVAIEKERKEDG